MDVTDRARILWATTANMAATAGAPDELKNARLALARMLDAGRTAGFPEPLEPTATERGTPAWTECVNAVIAAGTLPSVGAPAVLIPTAALLWTADPSVPGQPAPGHGLAWPAATRAVQAIGPLRSGDKADLRLFLYTAVDQTAALAKDGDAASGLFPRAATTAGAVVLATAASTAPAVVRDEAAARLRAARVAAARPWAILLFVVAVVLGIATNIWIYAAVDLAGQAAKKVDPGVCYQPPPPAAPAAGTPAAPAAGAPAAEAAAPARAPDPVEAAKECGDAWATAWTQVDPSRQSGKDWWSATLAELRPGIDLGGQLSLLGPLVLSAAAILALVLAAGLALQGLFFGALIDERNRLSLSRAQQLAWTIVLLGGYSVLAVFNVALLAGYARNRSQMDPAGSGLGLFPSMDATLWAVLGITVAISPYLSRRLSFPAVAGTAGVTGQEATVVAPAVARQFDQNAIASEARWTDLFQGERAADADHVDVSRLQHLVITGLLLSSYIVLLVQYARTIDGAAVILALRSGAPVFASMPPVDATFVGLLVLSHAAYLGFKTLPATTTS
jgi:hypothetical protein